MNTAPQIKPFFLVGCPRSGTTILQSLLCDNLHIALLLESGFFLALFGDSRRRANSRSGNPLRSRLKILWRTRFDRITPGRAREATEKLNALARELNVPVKAPQRLSVKAYRDTFVHLCDEYARRQGMTAWLEKSPYHLFLLDALEQIMPNAKFIHIIRHGPDVVASNVDAAAKFGDAISDFSPDYRVASKQYNNALRWHLRYIDNINHHFVWYGDLVNSADSVINGIARFLGVTWNENSGKKAIENIFVPEAKFYKLFTPDEQRYILDHLLKWPELVQKPAGELGRSI